MRCSILDPTYMIKSTNSASVYGWCSSSMNAMIFNRFNVCLRNLRGKKFERKLSSYGGVRRSGMVGGRRFSAN